MIPQVVFRVVTWIITVMIGAVRALCENAPLRCLSPPFFSEPSAVGPLQWNWSASSCPRQTTHTKRNARPDVMG